MWTPSCMSHFAVFFRSIWYQNFEVSTRTSKGQQCLIIALSPRTGNSVKPWSRFSDNDARWPDECRTGREGDQQEKGRKLLLRRWHLHLSCLSFNLSVKVTNGRRAGEVTPVSQVKGEVTFATEGLSCSQTPATRLLWREASNLDTSATKSEDGLH